MINPVFSELLEIIEEEYTKEDTIKFANEILEQFIKNPSLATFELSEAIEDYAERNDRCNICGSDEIEVTRDKVYDTDTRNEIVIELVKTCKSCGDNIDF